MQYSLEKKRELIEGKPDNMDETVEQVIKNPNSTCRIWELVSPKYETPIVLYFHKESREHHHAKDILDGFKGKFVQSDAYKAYYKIDGVVDVLCWAHAKRKFSDILKVAKGKHKVHETYCSKAIKYIDSLYHIEHKLAKNNASYDEIYQARQSQSLLNNISSKPNPRSISENVTWGKRKAFQDGKVALPYKCFLGYKKGENGFPEIGLKVLNLSEEFIECLLKEKVSLIRFSLLTPIKY